MYSTESLQNYLTEISKIPLLTAQQELDLVRKAKAGDLSAKQKLVESNLRFVVKIAKNYRNQGLSMLDLIQEGNLGLIESIDKFDESLGYRLTTYCGWWIRLAIQRAVEQKAHPVKIPVNKFEALKKIRSYSVQYRHQHGHEPSAKEVAKHMKTSLKKLKEIRGAETSFCSLDSSYQDDMPSYSASLADDRIEHPQKNLLEREMQEKLDNAMEVLSSRERKVLQWRFGLSEETDEPASLRNIGRWIGLSAEGVRRIEEQALSKLRRPVIQQRIEGFV